MFPGGNTSVDTISIPKGTLVNISCRLNENIIAACAIVRYSNGSDTCTEIHQEPVELIPGIVATRDIFLTVLFTVNTSNAEVDGLGCKGTSDNKIFNVTIFGELPFFYFVI